MKWKQKRQKLTDTANAVRRVKCLALSSNTRKGRCPVSYLCFYLEKLEQSKADNPKQQQKPPDNPEETRKQIHAEGAWP